MLEWILWCGLLIVQNAAFTLVSRARNSSSLTYHAFASLGSNGIWFLSQLILVNKMVQIFQTQNWPLAVTTGLVYVACTIIGSIGMHWIALRKIESRMGKREVAPA